ncbi:MAG: universal stress protein [Armatimonadetes bacterium]|nr:universal stress protein [Armatimonadota bacterium]
MIIEAREDIVNLRGDLRENLWPAIQAAANLLLKQQAKGIIINCAGLANCTEAGAQTFIDAILYIQKQGARIVLANMPEEVLRIVRSVPGLRSQAPIADSVEAARASLTLATGLESTADTEAGRSLVLVPLMEGMESERAMSLAIQMARERKGKVHLAYMMEIPKSLPKGAPVPEAEAVAKSRLAEAEAYVKKRNGVPMSSHVERTRDVGPGIVEMARSLNADAIVLSVDVSNTDNKDRLDHLVSILLERAPCELVLDRMKTKGA